MSNDFRATQIQTQKLIASGSTGTGARLLFYDIRSDNPSSVNNGNFTFGTSGIGQDIFLYISGGIGTRGTNQQRITCIGGDLHVSGNLSIGGNNNIGFRLQVTDYASTQSTGSNPEVVGQVIFPADQFSGSLELRTILSTTILGTTASVKFWNLTSGTYVDIGGSGQTSLATSNLTPTIVNSVNLIGTNGFSTGSQSIYELHLFTSTGSATVYVGGAELRPSGSFSSITIISSSTIFTSGTWIDNNSRLRTTASVAVGTDNIFASQKGEDVYFYVSGTQTSGSATSKIALFGGSVRISGALAIGSGSIIVDSNTVRFSTIPDVAISNSNGSLTFYDTGNIAGRTLTSLIQGNEVYWYSVANGIAETSGSVKITGSMEITGALHVTGSANFRGTATSIGGFSGSLTRLSNGSSYMLPGAGMTLSTGSSGAVTIASTITQTTIAGNANEIQYNDGMSQLTASNKFWFDNSVPKLYLSGTFFVSGDIFSTGSMAPVAGIVYSPNKITGNYTILNNDYLLSISSSTATNLILPSNPSIGKSFIIKDISGSASSSNITIATGSTSHRIDGVGTYTLSINYSSIQIAYLDTNFWGII